MHTPNMIPPTPIAPRAQPVRSSYVPTTMLPGFYIGSESDINANSIPNDGSISFFPYRDLSKIVIKQWSSPSTIETAVYVLESTYPQQSQQQSQSPLPAPPPPVNLQQTEQQTQESTQPSQQVDSALLNEIKQMNAGLAGAFKQIGLSLNSLNANMIKLNDRFVDGESFG